MGCNAALHLLLPETRPEEVERGWEPGWGWGARFPVPGAALPSSGWEASLRGGLEQRRGMAGGAEGKGQCEEGRPGAGGQASIERLKAPGSRGGWSATLLVVPRPP